ncbi:Rieske (2Fe-2S) protein [Cytophagales bacterium LB-30]|uniref:Rieske (2Fe-2S) protein n=1 Tax=Shiella aurantiaca TaxID=3058365 RepID=A0ABT8F8J7_9BACT|nr:Rieske (2Fe-2S) protein [Shiella aurantiaca]
MEPHIPANRMLHIKVRGTSICLAVFSKDDIKAFQNVCPHRGAFLSQGSLNFQQEVVCPLHAYRYHCGNGREAENRSPSLRIYTLLWQADGLYIQWP